MLAFPESLELSQLQAEHQQYKRLFPVWQTIEDLVVGGYQLAEKKHLYIVRRPDEDPKLYALRLAKFSYTPVLSDAIKEFSVKVTNAPMHVSGVEGERWDTFRVKTDGKKRTENELIAKIFRTLLCYGVAWAQIDKPQLLELPRTRLQEESLGILPYVVLYKPQEVIDWGLDEQGEVQWVKIRQIFTENDPFGNCYHRAVWTIIDAHHIAKYQTYVTIGSGGGILGIDGRKATQGKVPLLSTPIAHGRGRTPIVHITLDAELWSGNHAYLKALQHLNIENSWTDTATIAGYIQRVFKPSQPRPDNDPHFTYSEPDEDLLKVKSSNAHLLIGDDFKFAEASGSSLQAISEFVLDKIEQQIKAIICLGNVSAAKGVLEQSGVSKALDYSQFHDCMVRYGTLLVNFYEEILSQVALAMGDSAANPQVSGLDSFDVNTLDSLLEQSTVIKDIEQNLSPMARRLWYEKLALAMHSTVSAEDKEAMLKEFEAMSWDISHDVETTEAANDNARHPARSAK